MANVNFKSKQAGKTGLSQKKRSGVAHLSTPAAASRRTTAGLNEERMNGCGRRAPTKVLAVKPGSSGRWQLHRKAPE